MIIGRSLINEYYENEKLYSTGDNYLDELLERAFCEGYEYAQREFAEKEEEEEKKAKRKKIAKKAAIAAGATLAGIGAYQGVNAIRKNRAGKVLDSYNQYGFDSANAEDLENLTRATRIMNRSNKFDRFGHRLEGGVIKAGKTVGDAAKKTGKSVEEIAGKVKNKISGKKGE